MRVLVTRPFDSAARTARALERLGHAAFVCPLTEIIPTGAVLPDPPFDAIAATSAHAVTALMADTSHMLLVPFFAVGRQTAGAARSHGFSNVQQATGNADDLVAMILGALPKGSRVLFLAGEPRKPALEHALGAAGINVATAVVYRANAVAVDALTPLPTVDAVLHYSRASAQRFSAIARDPRHSGAVAGAKHLCLSEDAALGLVGFDPATVLCAKSPDETALLALFDGMR